MPAPFPSRSTVLVLSTLTFFAAGAILLAGPLDPPAGPVTSTYKTLTEVEPRTAISAANTPGDADSLFKITQPGSYYLTGNIAGVAGKHGIEIASSGVTLDLNGFELRGVVGSFDGVNISAVRGRNIEVKNGALRSWGDCGLEMEDNFGQPPAATLTNLRSSLNTRHGFEIASWSRVLDCYAQENSGHGFFGASSCAFVRCIASINTLDGINTNHSSTVTDCSASSNGGTGIAVNANCVVRGSVASNNTDGFSGNSSTFEACTAYLNSADGFSIGSGALLKSCNAHSNDGHGYSVSQHCSIIDSVAAENALNGIITSTGALISNCTVNANDGLGISLGSGAHAVGCTVVNNLGTGITATSNTLVRGNSVVNNGGTVATNANIRLIGSDARLEDNNVCDAPIGIEVTSAGNIIVRNTASGNTLNWSVVAGNACLVVLVTPAAAISGDSGGTSPGSTNPNANYTY